MLANVLDHPVSLPAGQDLMMGRGGACRAEYGGRLENSRKSGYHSCLFLDRN